MQFLLDLSNVPAFKSIIAVSVNLGARFGDSRCIAKYNFTKALELP